MIYVLAAMRTQDRRYRPFQIADAIAFNMIDTMEGDSARGMWVGKLLGAVRPKLDWTTNFTADIDRSDG